MPMESRVKFRSLQNISEAADSKTALQHSAKHLKQNNPPKKKHRKMVA